MLESAFLVFGSVFLLLLLRWLVVGSAKCVTHRNAQRLWRSYSLRVAIHVVLRGQFTCPYCNESTAMLSPEQAKEFSARRRRRRRSAISPTERDIWADL